jgi:hypothetical protein
VNEHSHEYAATWWPEVQCAALQWYGSRSAADRAERRAISNEKPLHNVLHTPRHRVPRGVRPLRENLSDARGTALLEKLREDYPSHPFTTADAQAISGQCKSSTQKSVRALLGRGEIKQVGVRNSVARDSGKVLRRSALYVVADSATADLPKTVVQSVLCDPPVMPHHQRTNGRGGRVDPRYPNGRDMDLLNRARASFGTSAFTFQALAKAAGSDLDTISKYLRRLRSKGLISAVGKAERPSGTRGHAPTLYVVAEAAEKRPLSLTASSPGVNIHTTEATA